MSKYLDNDGVLYFWQKLKTLFAGKVDKVTGKGLSANDYTTDEKNKLAGVAAGANNYSLPIASVTALGGVKIGSNMSISDSGALTASIPAATTGANGLMSAADKTKLNGVASGANLYVHPTVPLSIGSSTAPDANLNIAAQASVTGYTGGVTVDVHGIADATSIETDAGGHLQGIQSKSASLFIPRATSAADGVLSSADKAKLDAFGAASAYALKSDIVGLYKYKGTKASVSALPTTGNAVGDVWDVGSGMNYVWTGSAWDALGEVFSITSVTNAEIDTIVAS